MSEQKPMMEKIRDVMNERDKLLERVKILEGGKRFPLQVERRYEKDPRGSIPWEIAEQAYLVYASRYGKSQTLERLAERAGFSNGEMDMFLPNWRELSDEKDKEQSQLTKLKEALGIVDDMEFAVDECGSCKGNAELASEALTKLEGEGD